MRGCRSSRPFETMKSVTAGLELPGSTRCRKNMLPYVALLPTLIWPTGVVDGVPVSACEEVRERRSRCRSTRRSGRSGWVRDFVTHPDWRPETSRAFATSRSEKRPISTTCSPAPRRVRGAPASPGGTRSRITRLRTRGVVPHARLRRAHRLSVAARERRRRHGKARGAVSCYSPARGADRYRASLGELALGCSRRSEAANDGKKKAVARAATPDLLPLRSRGMSRWRARSRSSRTKQSSGRRARRSRVHPTSRRSPTLRSRSDWASICRRDGEGDCQRPATGTLDALKRSLAALAPGERRVRVDRRLDEEPRRGEGSSTRSSPRSTRRPPRA